MSLYIAIAAVYRRLGFETGKGESVIHIHIIDTRNLLFRKSTLHSLRLSSISGRHERSRPMASANWVEGSSVVGRSRAVQRTGSRTHSGWANCDGYQERFPQRKRRERAEDRGDLVVELALDRV